MGYSVNGDSPHRRLADRNIFCNALQRPKYHVRSRAIARDFDSRCEVFVNCFKQRFTTNCVSATEPAQMAFIHSRIDELASVSCSRVAECKSLSHLAAVNAGASYFGTIKYPIRRAGNTVRENVPK